MIMCVLLRSQNTHVVKKNTEVLLVTSQETVLEVKSEKTKSMFMSSVQTAGPSHIVQVGRKIFEWVTEFKYLRKTLVSRYCMHEEINDCTEGMPANTSVICLPTGCPKT